MEEDNVILANFLGLLTIDTEGINFHTDWNWLLKVVEKIESLGNYGFTIYRKSVNINGVPIRLSNTKKETKIEAVHSACVYFVKWYNAGKE